MGLRISRSLAVMAALGFASGFPLFLTGFTLKQWMAVRGVDVTTIGLASLIGLPYSLKFLWAPILDHGILPAPLRRFGRWRAWLLLTQPLLALSCLALANCDPATTPRLMLLMALAVAFLSANQDIVIDAWRIALFPPHKQGIALTCCVWGYRIAMLAAGSGIIWASQFLGWHHVYDLAALIMALGIVPTLLAPVPPDRCVPLSIENFDWASRIDTAVIAPFRHFLSRADLRWALAFTTLFNVGGSLADTLTPKFYRDLGYSSHAVASAIGLPSLAGTIIGMAFGGWLITRIGVKRTLILAAIAQTIALSLYFALALCGPNLAILTTKVVFASITSGMATAAFLAFLSQLCSSTLVATEYALLSSLATLIPRLIDGYAGPMQKALGWIGFYGLSIFACLPALLIMLHILHQDNRGRIDMQANPG